MSRYIGNQSQRFAIRKYKVGVASVLVCSAILLGAQVASADEVAVEQPIPTELVVPAKAEEPALPLTEPSPVVAKETDVKEIESPANDKVEPDKVAEASGEPSKTPVTEADKALEQPKTPALGTPPVEVEVNQAAGGNVRETKAEVVKSSDKPQTALPLESEKVPNQDKVGDKQSIGAPIKEQETDQKLEQTTRSEELEKGPAGKTMSGLLRSAKYTTRSANQTAFRSSAGAAPLAPSGTYYFTSTSGIQAEPKLSSPDLASYSAGQSVNYDRVLTADGYQWISYIAYSGNRRYIAVKELPKPAKPVAPTYTPPSKPAPAQPIPSSGRYTFTSRVSVKNEPKISAPERAFYNAGQSVFYDSTLIADGQQWISYINYNGGRSYIAIGAATSSPTTPKPVPVPSTTLTSPNGRPDYSANAYPYGQCTWGAKSRAPWASNSWGNAGEWAMNAQRDGFTIGDVPVVGAIAVWTNTGYYEGVLYGHVAVVTEVVNNNLIRVTESNVNDKKYISDHRGLFNPTGPYTGGVVKYIYPPSR